MVGDDDAICGIRDKGGKSGTQFLQIYGGKLDRQFCPKLSELPPHIPDPFLIVTQKTWQWYSMLSPQFSS
jgi:hypothetical protein